MRQRLEDGKAESLVDGGIDHEPRRTKQGRQMAGIEGARGKGRDAGDGAGRQTEHHDASGQSSGGEERRGFSHVLMRETVADDQDDTVGLAGFR